MRRVHILVPAAVVVVAVAAVFTLSPRQRSRDFPLARGLSSGLQLASTGVGSGTGSPAANAEPNAGVLEAVYAERKLIRTGTLAIEVEAYAVAADRAVAVAAAHGGYLADARATREPGDRRRGTLTLRVEARSFDAAFAELKALGQVQSATVETQDVTRAYADLEVRLSVKRDAQARLREILRTRTGSLSDLVEAERELSRLVEEAERLEGERRYFDHQVALSTITLDLFEPAAFFRDNAVSPLTKALREALPLLARSSAVMLYALAAALPWGIAALVVWRIRRRTRVRRLIRVAGAEG